MADDEKKPKKSRREVMYDKGKPKAEAKPAEAAPAAKKEGDAPPAAEAAAPDMGAKHAEMRDAMYKRHEGERKDAHGNHRDNLRKMVMRHEKEIGELKVAQEAEMAGAAAPMGEGNAPAAPGAGAEPVAPPVEAA